MTYINIFQHIELATDKSTIFQNHISCITNDDSFKTICPLMISTLGPIGLVIKWTPMDQMKNINIVDKFHSKLLPTLGNSRACLWILDGCVCWCWRLLQLLVIRINGKHFRCIRINFSFIPDIWTATKINQRSVRRVCTLFKLRSVIRGWSS